MCEKKTLALSLPALLGSCLLAGAQDRPNIMWLTYEDSSASEYGCYGNESVHTPVIDSLAARGIQFMHAWAAAPQSSPARSGLITGCYATTYGMDLHPVEFQTPDGILFPQLLRDAGYYCTNNNKTHYNTTLDHTACWDECDRKASYKSGGRAEGQPFFAVYNSVTSHMGRVRTFTTDGRRDYMQEGIDTATLKIPSYLPDLPEVRSDYAGHLESVQDIDKWLGIFLDDLQKSGEADNTIVIFFSDHGGCLPRGKGYLYESGLQVPMIAYFPPKWEHLAGGLKGKTDQLVNFVDIAPTTLSLAGIEPPKSMQGRAVFGKYAKPAPEMMVSYAANHLHHFTPARAVTDGRFHYLRTYIPYRQFALRNYYQWGMPANRAWDELVLSGKNTNPVYALPFSAHPAEMLFDNSVDPGQVNDLSSDPAYKKQLKSMRRHLRRHIRKTVDLGFFLPETRAEGCLYDNVRSCHYPLRRLWKAVELAGVCTPKDMRVLMKEIRSEYPDFRFWGVVGFAHLAQSGQISDCPEELLALISDPNPHVACEAAYAVAYLGHADEAVERLLNPVREEERKIGYSALECLSLDPAMHEAILRHVSALESVVETLPHKNNEDAGLMAQGILVNLHRLPVSAMHGPEAYEEGLKLNAGRRKIAPRP